MPDLSCEYMDLNLKNPIIVSSCGLSKDVEGIIKIANAGAGAVVLKSLFEEQIYFEKAKNALEQDMGQFVHPEAFNYIEEMSMNTGPDKYIELINEAKKKVDIPIIASLNCLQEKWWIEYAKKIETSKADGLELNMASLSLNTELSPEKSEGKILQTLKEVLNVVTKPVALKLGDNFSSLSRIISKVDKTKLESVVLFNRFYQIDIDINKEELKSGFIFSSPNEHNNSLRWISLLSGNYNLDFCGSRGVHGSKEAIKMLLAGADAVQLCSTLYINKLSYIETICKEIKEWMDQKGYSSINDFKGKLRQKNSKNPDAYERLQYIKAIVGVE